MLERHDRLVRVDLYWGWDMTLRLEVLTMPEMLRRLTGARDIHSLTLILDGRLHVEHSVKSLAHFLNRIALDSTPEGRF